MNRLKRIYCILGLLSLAALSIIVLKWIVVDVLLLAIAFNFEPNILFSGKEGFIHFLSYYALASLSLVLGLRLYIKYIRNGLIEV